MVVRYIQAAQLRTLYSHGLSDCHWEGDHNFWYANETQAAPLHASLIPEKTDTATEDRCVYACCNVLLTQHLHMFKQDIGDGDPCIGYAA